MNTNLLKTFFVALFLITATGASAHDFYVDGIYYNITDATAKTVEVTYKGGSYSDYDNEYKGSVVIPSVVIYNNVAYSVTTIGNYAFYNCTGLTGVTIPNSVTSIGERAFMYCEGLTGVTIPNSVTSIGERAFMYCKGLTGVTIGNSVISIGYEAFKFCEGLTSIEIPNSVTSIGDGAFYGCTGLTSITIPNGVTSIGDGAFYGCSGLTSITIPNSVTSIGKYAFYGCSGLTGITIPNSVTSIGDGAFCDCSGLTAVHISDLAAWCGIDFTDDLSNPLIYAQNLYLNGKKVTNLVIPDGVTEIKSSAFSGCSGLTSITIPNSVTSIGRSAFSGCTGLTAVHIRDLAAWCGIDFELGYYDSNFSNPLYYAHNLYLNGKKVTNLVIPDGVTEIKDYTFYNCSGLTGITIPNSVTSIGDYAFYGCTGLTNIIIPNSVTSIGYDVFMYCSKITIAIIGSGVANMEGNVFNGCDNLTTIIVDKNNSNYDGRDNCNAIIETASNTLVAACKNSIIPSSVTSIGEGAFYNCSGLTGLTIPNSVTSIGTQAFYNCSGLTCITIPNSVTSIGRSAFSGCSGLKEIYSLSETPATISSDTFSDYSAMLYVPLGAKSAYQAVAYWENFDNIVEIDVETGNAHYPLADWVSTNKYDNTTSSNTYSIVAIAGSVLSFDWQVSSESGYDWFIVTFNGAEIVKGTGEDSGRYKYKFEQAGTYDLTAKYVKDDGYSKGDDCGKIYNILLTSPTDINEIEADDSFNGLRDTYYDLKGSVVENPTKGIYIYNGKKVLVQ